MAETGDEPRATQAGDASLLPVVQDEDGLTRRGFLRGSGMIAVAAGVAGLASCERLVPADEHVPEPGPRVRPPGALPAGEMDGVLRFLNEQQARTLDAVLARIIPGDEDDPGAREVGVLFYIDNLLASFEGHAEKTYMGGPFAEGYAGDEPPGDDDEDTIWVPEDVLPRYGWQSRFVPRDFYDIGLSRLDRLSQERHETDFVDLGDDEQDALLEALEEGEDEEVEETFDPLDPGEFFSMIRHHTLEGFLSDPVYGGNRGMAGWRLIGFPGAQRSYSPAEMMTEQEPRPPRSLLELDPFNPYHRHDHHDPPITVRRPHPLGPTD